MPECNYEPVKAFTIRQASPEDAALLLSLERKLAEHEHALDSLVMTESMLKQALQFGQCEGLILTCDQDERVAGYALFYQNFATFPGHPGMFLESLYVEPEFRGTTAATLLFAKLRSIAVQRNYARIDWIVLHDNEIAKRFYSKIGAALQDEWNLWRIELQKSDSSENGYGLEPQSPEYKRRLSLLTEKLRQQHVDQQKIEEPVLRKYLLGFADLDDATRHALQGVETLARKMVDLELSLFQDYVAGKLNDQERNNFEGIYFTNEANPGKYRFRAWCKQQGLLDKYFPKYG